MSLPVLVSRWDEAMRQLDALRVDIKEKRIDCLLTVAVVGGQLDIRGLGCIDSEMKAMALLKLAMGHFMDARRSGGMNKKVLAKLLENAEGDVLRHSLLVSSEAQLWFKPVE
jgi:hypothetical protein